MAVPHMHGTFRSSAYNTKSKGLHFDFPGTIIFPHNWLHWLFESLARFPLARDQIQHRLDWAVTALVTQLDYSNAKQQPKMDQYHTQVLSEPQPDDTMYWLSRKHSQNKAIH